ncbi:MAG: acyl-CoA desaturase [Pseudomonas sp.]
MDTTGHTPRIRALPETNAHDGVVRWAPVKSIWYCSHVMIAVVGGYLTFSWSALAVFLLFSAITLCLGHSLGMHRRLIHNSYACPRWMEYFFVHLGVMVGLAGPFGMTQQHDLRDWAQRQSQCHSYLRHGEHMLLDGWWQLNCDLKLENPPVFEPEDRIKNDPVYLLMERTWMLQQLPWALLLFYFGGIAWVVWGISVRVAVSITGHWLIGYFAHNAGQRDWHVNGAAVQGHNVRFAGLITMGESWHNNHHAYPGSAKLGIRQGQTDPGWWVLKTLHNLGLVWEIKLPQDLPHRPELVAMEG